MTYLKCLVRSNIQYALAAIMTNLLIVVIVIMTQSAVPKRIPAKFRSTMEEEVISKCSN